MAPKEEPSFYLYSIGYSPKILTLGTLVYRNYGMPEERRATFPLSPKEFDELEKQGEIISMPVSGCFTYNKKSKFGLGINLAELATVDFEYAKNCNKLVEAKAGKRVILKDQNKFFEKVLQQDHICDKLKTWLTAAKSEWILAQATFRKPKVYCCTGFYELSQTTARILNDGNFSTNLSISPALVGLASGIPIGGTIGPFANGQTLQSNFSAPEAGIWAARYHQLKVEYLQMATQGTTQLPPNITLKPDCTHPTGGLMKEDPMIQETKVVEQPDEIKRAQAVIATLEDVKEIKDESPDEEYWEAFAEAEKRLEMKFDPDL